MRFLGGCWIIKYAFRQKTVMSDSPKGLSYILIKFKAIQFCYMEKQACQSNSNILPITELKIVSHKLCRHTFKAILPTSSRRQCGWHCEQDIFKSQSRKRRYELNDHNIPKWQVSIVRSDKMRSLIWIIKLSLLLLRKQTFSEREKRQLYIETKRALEKGKKKEK